MLKIRGVIRVRVRHRARDGFELAMVFEFKCQTSNHVSFGLMRLPQVWDYLAFFFTKPLLGATLSRGHAEVNPGRLHLPRAHTAEFSLQVSSLPLSLCIIRSEARRTPIFATYNV